MKDLPRRYGSFLVSHIINISDLIAGCDLWSHIVRDERIECRDLSHPVAYDLRIVIAPGIEILHDHFTPHYRSHIRVRLIL